MPSFRGNVHVMSAYSPANQSRIGLLLAALVMLAWLAGHVAAVWLITAWEQPVAAIFLFALQSWLSVGLFIIAHDAMHGSLAPGGAATNRVVGEIALRLYMGFSYARLLPKHHAHHDHVGGEGDPDFDTGNPSQFWKWYVTFMGRYLDWYVFWVTGAIVIGYVALLWLAGGPERAVHILFWAGPSLVASIQLFYFGTFRPHRHVEGDDFIDDHRSRSNDFGPLISLLTCFHFGYHHEHHDRPYVPWWGLPAVRKQAKAR